VNEKLFFFIIENHFSENELMFFLHLTWLMADDELIQVMVLFMTPPSSPEFVSSLLRPTGTVQSDP
jgi:hypothetical protein